MLVSIDPIEERPINLDAIAPIAPQFVLKMIGLVRALPQFFTIPEEMFSVKDSVTYGLLAREYLGVESNGSSGPPVVQTKK